MLSTEISASDCEVSVLGRISCEACRTKVCRTKVFQLSPGRRKPLDLFARKAATSKKVKR